MVRPFRVRRSLFPGYPLYLIVLRILMLHLTTLRFHSFRTPILLTYIYYMHSHGPTYLHTVLP
jgi:hypothetical protein